MKGRIAIKYLLYVIIGALAFATIAAVSSNIVQGTMENAIGTVLN